MAQLLKGLPVANALTEDLIRRAEALKENRITPTLAIVRLGERKDDISYETGAMKRCGKVGIAVRHFLLPADCAGEDLLDTIRQINEDPSIHGCLMFRPLPSPELEAAACALSLKGANHMIPWNNFPIKGTKLLQNRFLECNLDVANKDICSRFWQVLKNL